MEIGKLQIPKTNTNINYFSALFGLNIRDIHWFSFEVTAEIKTFKAKLRKNLGHFRTPLSLK